MNQRNPIKKVFKKRQQVTYMVSVADTERFRCRVIAMTRLGFTRHVIALKLRVSWATVDKCLKLNKVKAARVKSMSLPEASIAKEYLAGKSTHTLARMYSVSAPTINKCLRQSGVTLRPPTKEWSRLKCRKRQSR